MGVEWAAIATASIMFTLGATSPGPSLAVVIRNTIIGGRARGVSCAIGHGLGFGFYATAAVFGLVILMETSPEIFTLLQLIGVALLIWMGTNLLRSEHQDLEEHESKRQGFMEGFLIAFFNPKIAVFMLAVLATVLEPGMGEETKWALAILGMSIDAIWYVIVALALTTGSILTWMKEKQIVFHQVTGIMMIGLAVWVVFKQLTDYF
jgi:threonine/homoserine/homoserine lactone efflux protein